MRRAFRILAALAILIGLWSHAHAQVPMTGAGLAKPASGGGATSCSTLISALSVTVVDCWDADQGIVKSGANVTTWTGANGSVLGLNTVTGESPPNSPTFSSSSFSTKAGLTFAIASGQYLATTAAAVAFGSSQPSFFVSAIITGSSPNFGRALSFTANGQSGDFNNSTSIAAIVGLTAPAVEVVQNFLSSSNSSISLNTASRLGLICDNTNCLQYLNNVQQTTNAFSFTLGATGQISVGDGAGSGGALLDGTIRRMVVTKGVVSSGDRTTIDTFLQN